MNLIANTEVIRSSVGLSDHKISKANQERSTNIDIAEGANPNSSTNDWPEDKVSISVEANEKLKGEIKENITVSDGSKSKSIMAMAEEIKQKTIENVKERIEKIAEELQTLEGQDDEGSKERAELLQQQMNDLNGQLLTLMTN